MNILERLAAPFREVEQEWREHQQEVEDEWRRRHVLYLQELQREFADAPQLQLRPYRELHISEIRLGKIPAVEYFHYTAEVALYNLLRPDLLSRAAVVKALAMRLDRPYDSEEENVLIDVKPTERAPIEYGAINLGPVLEFHHADGTRWRFYIEVVYSAAPGSFRGGIQTRRFICECTL